MTITKVSEEGAKIQRYSQKTDERNENVKHSYSYA
jgi:hypothetical protein